MNELREIHLLYHLVRDRSGRNSSTFSVRIILFILIHIEGVHLNIKILFTDGKQNVVKFGPMKVFVVPTGDPIVLPCIATHPNVTISLTREIRAICDCKNTTNNPQQRNILDKVKKLMSQNIAKYFLYNYWILTIQKDLLSENQSMWSFDRGKGLTLRSARIDDSFGYNCIGTMNNKTSEELFDVIVYGIRNKIHQFA